MDAIATYSILNFNVEIPDWLQYCLKAASSAAEEPVGDHTLLIAEAFKFAYQLHEGQYRKSGEPYIAHPIAVADLLRDLGGNSTMIAAGFLHDVVEDTEITPEEIESRFGVEVRNLVEGVTKLSKFNFSSKTERQAENFRRMFLAMAADIRVIVVKLADRLHNMRTLEYLKPEKQVQIAQETRDIFAPLANRLGIGRFKWELEDLAFKYLETNAYREIQSLVSERRSDREQRLKEVSELLRERIHKTGVHCVDISSRPKHLYGIYQKMQRQNKGFHEIYDIAAMRVIVESKEECYRALAVVHDLFRPIPGRFKDYIGLPKPNRYQSLHTGVIGFNGRPIEVQIRTLEMHHVAEWGIAAHWKYKETGGSNTTKFTADDEKLTWLRQLLEWQKDLKDAQEYMENIKDNLFDEDVYVFTPDGDVVALSRGATAVDFAYRIHTEVGNHCAGVRVNGEWRVLDCPLKNGDIVEIITTKNAHPSLDWLNFVVTASARNRIRQWFKRSHREENVARGRELLEKELGKKGFEALLKSAPMQIVAERCNYHKVEDLLAGLGHGAVTLNFVVKRLREELHAGLDNEPGESEVIQEYSSSTPIHPQSQLPSKKHPIAGVEGLLYRLAACCNPLPGESIIGVVTRTKGISIHRQGCVNVENVLGERLVPVSWNPTDIDDGRPQTYPVNVQIEVIDRVGVFKDILSRLSDQNINVRKAQVKTQYGKPALIDLCIDILDHQQLNRSFAKIQHMSDVLNIRRVSQVEECN
ncbi:MAG: bifunctional (p)ppGpp synthetase/guanosine-3',5'-bis(diphosphate) 3'-pyrophosphohydrolase [Moorea sp. SIO4G2]|uniref:RelA/SpoT family protein n=1 Tax=unclassified Moorena TaxID=2683338 RepID=UPI0013FAA581|nr:MULTISPECIES: bifunctional (p)ppGpp synthetase/guanosine-3',5'-bis(diphosphate) 3'-pyrophosphohydrolase [unclassified Moorena]NEO17030.1 bifunctional (p)ppGpp synthetase/guanosine-3',5'-bis(diphosphate) 3'-pyrophosphohydrolase [Moorena sp. SIO3E8]NEO60370.1 bifunctional (p)ppGpp synthetase/guanosine-3',5'-bis(diphosphate) 3'-pyrophosphohydrolase [Moorena sp. SIO4G2]NEQ03606.1 bifunctional (p)ppGpp synthetase/guanosine-3',5'-bis(diphosphate) 3'-pyrophosphohydrolase [Moorena sp. SIO3F7]